MDTKHYKAVIYMALVYALVLLALLVSASH